MCRMWAQTSGAMPTAHADYAKALPGRPSGQKFYLHAPCFIVPLTLPIAQNSDSLDGQAGMAGMAIPAKPPPDRWPLSGALWVSLYTTPPPPPPLTARKENHKPSALCLKSNCKGATTETETAPPEEQLRKMEMCNMCNCAIKLNFSYISPVASDGQEWARWMSWCLRDSHGLWSSHRWEKH